MFDVGKAPPPVSLRLGRAGQKALEDLAQLRGVTKAEAARQAIEEVAEREREQMSSVLAADARRLAADPAYVAEAREIVEWMEELSDPW